MDCWSKLIGGKKLVKDEPFGEEGGDHLAWNSRQRKHSLPTGVPGGTHLGGQELEVRLGQC